MTSLSSSIFCDKISFFLLYSSKVDVIFSKFSNSLFLAAISFNKFLLLFSKSEISLANNFSFSEFFNCSLLYVNLSSSSSLVNSNFLFFRYS
ncbi:unnamed protein product [Blepharisma stoltei]|uniref:Uncharacterized protein n=1 Tax=Blepharisma stoltei TaxID=1481888 RepID=A0AAU9JBW8_9CILI|nr:unnamed protein product [Blepharisma stoltei]